MDYITTSDHASNCRTYVRDFSKDPGGRCERPRGMANLRKQVDMSKATDRRIANAVRRDEPEDARAHHAHPVVRQLVERFGSVEGVVRGVGLNLLRLHTREEPLTEEQIEEIAARAAARQEALAAERQPRRRCAVPAGTEVVYYMRIGNRIKIGTSTNLEERLAAINPEELMAAELGGFGMEHLRHRQFAALRTHGEWFRFEGALAEHIANIRRTE